MKSKRRATQGSRSGLGLLGRAAIWAVLALVVLWVSLVQAVDVGEVVRQAQARVERLGAWAPVAYIGLYVAATLLALPGLPFTLAAPALFGSLAAFAIMVIASSLSAVSAFLIARYLARGAVSRILARSGAFARVNRLLDAHAWIIIPFLRIVPFPFALNNYGFGLTAISFRRYVVWSEVGMVPMNAALVLGAAAVMRAAAGQASWPLVGLAAGATGIVVALAILGRRVWITGPGSGVGGGACGRRVGRVSNGVEEPLTP